jgi:flagellar export protein FliJ
MRPFHFRLDSVLDDRVRREEVQAQELSRVRRAAGEARRHREDLETLLESERSAHSQVQGARPAGHLRNSLVVMEQIRQRIDALASRELEIDRELQEQVVAFRSAYQDREALTRLRLRQEEHWTAEGVRREQAELDEAARTLFHRAESDARAASQVAAPVSTSSAGHNPGGSA